MSVTCLFPKCGEQLQLHDLEDHIRRHLHLKLYRCYCEKRFYALASLQEHLETIADDEIHCIANDCPGDVYLKALVSRIVADFKSSENGTSIPMIASNLRVRAHAVASPSGSVTPTKNSGRKRQVNVLQKEAVPRKVPCLMQMENSANDLTVVVPSRDHTRANREQSLASTTSSAPLKTPTKNVSKLMPARTLHEAITDVINMPTLLKEKMTLPSELANLGNVACQKCSLSFTVEFNERRTHVANMHVSANQGNWRYTGDYRKELAYQMRECFPDLASEDDLCVVCYETTVKPTRYTSETGRMGHIRAVHLPADKFLPCPFAFELDGCKMHRFKSTEDVNQHCQLVHHIEGYSTLKDTNKPLFEQFLHYKRIYNLFCTELKCLYFPVPLNPSAVTPSNSPPRNEAAKDNDQVVTHADSDVQQEAQSANDQPVKQEETLELQKEVLEVPPTKSTTSSWESRPLTWKSWNRSYSALSSPYQGRRSFPYSSSRAWRSPFATAQRGGRGRQQQIRPNHDWHFKGNKF